MSGSIYRISGGSTLHGVAPISGGKNNALPSMAAALLTQEPVVLSNVPDIADVRVLASILPSGGR